MSIPKIIHYCWFGYNPKPKLALKCIKSWKKYCPDYQIIEWNEENFDISSCPLYVRQAYEAKKWAFVTDYVRLKVVYDHGGIYLDTDVELKKKLDSLLQHDAYFGFENGIHIATGLGFGSVKGHDVLKEMMLDYETVSFLKEDGSFDSLPCPQRNTEVFLRRGLAQNDSRQVLRGNILILPSIYLCPVIYESKRLRRSKETISIHWFTSLWLSEEQAKNWDSVAKKIRRAEDIHDLLHTPNRVLKRMLGDEKYEKLKSVLR